MGIQNGPAPEGRATGATDWMTSMTMERDALQVQLQQSEQLRQEAFRACEIHRQEYEKLRLERDEWKAAVEYQQQQATQLRMQVAALEAGVEDWQSANKKLAGQVADKQRQSQVLTKERDDRTAQLQSTIDELRRVKLEMKDLTTARDAAFREIGELRQQRDELQAKLEAERGRVAELQRQSLIAQGTIDEWRDAWERATGVTEQHRRQVSDLQAQLEAAAVTPAQQPDGNAAERLERVRRMIGEIWGWYACIECLGEQSAETWEQVGALLGHLQQEAD